eukprot:SAG31_NODE_225_length_19846_cov_19.057983_19_plen_238_part_00
MLQVTFCGPQSTERERGTERDKGAASSEMADLQASYTKLYAFVNDENFDAASEIATAILGDAPDDQDVKRTKVLCLMHLSKYAEALNKIEEWTDMDWSMEYAYVLYSLHRSADALEALSKLPSKTPASMHLEAQTRYRMGEYEAVTRIYEELRKMGEESADFSTNVLAAYGAPMNLADTVSISRQSDRVLLVVQPPPLMLAMPQSRSWLRKPMRDITTELVHSWRLANLTKLKSLSK